MDEEEAQLLTATIAGGLVDAVSADAQKAQRGCKQSWLESMCLIEFVFKLKSYTAALPQEQPCTCCTR